MPKLHQSTPKEYPCTSSQAVAKISGAENEREIELNLLEFWIINHCPQLKI